jgi:hypothetical protein
MSRGNTEALDAGPRFEQRMAPYIANDVEEECIFSLYRIVSHELPTQVEEMGVLT